jgi:peptidoglycan/LPS O-acetylase OafA/YrhL
MAPLFSGLPFSILILGLAQIDRNNRFEIPKNLSYWAGTLSFGVYAWHVPLSGIVDRYSPENFQANTILRLTVLTTLSCVFGYLVSNYFERPVQRYSRKLVELKLR